MLNLRNKEHEDYYYMVNLIHRRNSAHRHSKSIKYLKEVNPNYGNLPPHSKSWVTVFREAAFHTFPNVHVFKKKGQITHFSYNSLSLLSGLPTSSFLLALVCMVPKSKRASQISYYPRKSLNLTKISTLDCKIFYRDSQILRRIPKWTLKVVIEKEVSKLIPREPIPTNSTEFSSKSI